MSTERPDPGAQEMATQELVQRWLGTDADTPSGRAWGAVILADYSNLAETLERHGEQATGTVQGPLGHPVNALTAGATRGDTRAVTMLLDAGADPGEKASGHMVATPMAWAIVGHRGRLSRVCAADRNGAREAGNRATRERRLERHGERASRLHRAPRSGHPAGASRARRKGDPGRVVPQRLPRSPPDRGAAARPRRRPETT